MLPEKAALNSPAAGFFHIFRGISRNPNAINKVVRPILIAEGCVNLNSSFGNIYRRGIIQILNNTLSDKSITHTRRNTRGFLLGLFVSYKDLEEMLELLPRIVYRDGSQLRDPKIIRELSRQFVKRLYRTTSSKLHFHSISKATLLVFKTRLRYALKDAFHAGATLRYCHFSEV